MSRPRNPGGPPRPAARPPGRLAAKMDAERAAIARAARR